MGDLAIYGIECQDRAGLEGTQGVGRYFPEGRRSFTIPIRDIPPPCFRCFVFLNFFS
jgi:hypothetical protein